MANYKGHVVGGLLCNTAYIAAVKVAPGDLLAKTANILSDWQFVVGL